ncbi:MAG: DUF5320 domain-containing protein [Chitinispirillaceae bacterium]|nr:DUF5320 domain-containing protein [Chitinispirillaceae bacterium]
MPNRDGTGPFGFGSGTGRGRGWYRSATFMSRGSGVRRIGFFSALIPVAVAALRDLANPGGLLRSAGRRLITRKTDGRQKPVNASFTVLDETDSKA